MLTTLERPMLTDQQPSTVTKNWLTPSRSRVASLQPPPSGRFHVARNLPEVMDAWRLVYNVYVRNGYIPPNPFRVHTSPHAINRRTAVFYSLRGPFVESTITAMLDGRGGLPLDVVYKPELDALRRKNRQLSEHGLLAHDQQIAGSQAADVIDGQRTLSAREQTDRVRTCLIHLMCRTVFYSLAMNSTDIVIGVHPKHARFYIRAWGFRQAGPVRRYSTVNDRPVILLRMDLSEVLRRPEQPYVLEFLLNNPIPLDTFGQRCTFEPSEVTSSCGPLHGYLCYKHPEWEEQTIGWTRRKVS